ncbi:MAG: FAD-binding oxidoreductase [Caulobacter sp.]
MKAAGTAVIGGGIVGTVCALALRRAGEDVLLIDPMRDPPPASYGNAGHIAVEQVEPLASPAALASAPRRLFALGGALDFRLADATTWMPWAARYIRACTPEGAARGRAALGGLLADALPAWRRLAASVERPDLVVEQGHVVVWESGESARKGMAAWSAADIGRTKLSPLDEPTLRRVARQVSTPLAGGARFEGSAQVSDPGQVLKLLGEAFEAAGGKRLTAGVSRLAPSGRFAQVVLEGGERIAAGRILVTGGVGSGALMRSLGHVAPVIAERGYHLEGGAGDWVGLPPVVFEDRSLILTRFGDRLRAASFVEFGREGSPPDPMKWDRLRTHLDALGIRLQGQVAQWSGARPTLPDYLPAIGASTRADNLYYAFGHQHLGLTLAATTGEIVARLMAGQAPDLSAFDIERFAPGRGKTRTSA